MDLKVLRARNGFIKQLDFASAVGVRQSTVASWEKGIGIPNILKAKKIAQVLNVSIDEVVSCFESQNN